MTRVPKKFVGLHNHTTIGSIGDAIGTPYEHLKFAKENGLDAHAITDHGNMNSYSYAYHALKKLGGGIKYIPGIEAYFHPSLKDWAAYKASQDEIKRLDREALKSKELLAGMEVEPGEEFAEHIKDMEDMSAAAGGQDSDDTAAVVENEDESKSSGLVKDPLKRRHHLVLLAKNSQGLKTLFRLTSESFVNGFYRFPRMDFEMLKREANGNIIASSACIAGMLADIVFRNQTEPDWKNFKPNQENFEKIQEELKETIERFQDALGKENYYAEIQFNKLGAQHLVNYHLLEASRRTGVKLVATVDAHYSHPDHWKEREIYKMMAWMTKTKDGPDKDKLPKSIDDIKCELYPKNVEQIWNSYKTYCADYDFYNDDTVCDAIEQSWTIAHEQIENPTIDKTVKLPSISKIVDADKLEIYRASKPGSTEDELAFKALLELCKERLVSRNLHQDASYVERLKRELDDVKYLKFSKYFLTYHVLMREVGNVLLTGSGRGSAAGSLISYLLGITQVDPVRFGTLWERFLTKHKTGAPDIDSDSSDRDEATRIIERFFGEENVIAVTNFSQLQVASLIKDLAKIYEVPFEEVNLYTNKMRNEALEVAKTTPGFDAGVWQFTLEEAEANSPSYREFMKKMEVYPEFSKALQVLFKQIRSQGKHAGGVCITENAFDNMPVIRSKGRLQTPWPEGVNARHLEEFGFLKFDILGLGTLRVIENTIRRILKRQGVKNPTFDMVKDWFNKNLHPDANKFDDMHVYKNVFWEKRFAGIFQFIDPKVQEYVSQVKPTSIFDLAAVTSIFRPGPLALGSDKDYLSRKLSGKTPYAHPLLKEVLGDTFGTIIYQEHLQLIYHKLAGVPLDQTDAVRKAFTKKDISNLDKARDERLRLRKEFVEKCEVSNDIPAHVSSSIFDDLDKCAAYLFNKSHAISYTICSYQCAHLLTYHQDEWIASYIDYCATEKGKVAGGEDPKAVALKEAGALGYSIGKPDINLSKNEYTIELINGQKVLLPSFSSIKNIGVSVQREINDYRPYKTLEELLWTENSLHLVWRHSKFNKRALGNLIKMESFASMDLVGPDKTFKNYKQMYEVLVERADQLKRAVSRKKNRNHKELLAQFIQEVQTMDDWTVAEKLKNQLELAGSVDRSLIVTPDIEAFLTEHDIQPIELYDNDQTNYWAIVSGVSEALTKTKKKYLKLKLMSFNGMEFSCNIWNYNPATGTLPEKNSVIIASFKKNDFGMSTEMRKLLKVKI